MSDVPRDMEGSAPAEPFWFVAHTRPRAEKKLSTFCVEQSIEHHLPLYRSVRKYRGKKVVFLKPLFPGYVFLRMPRTDRPRVLQNRHVANLLDVPDAAEFEQQLRDILAAVDSGLEVDVAPEIRAGVRVRIRSGPLRGMEAFVESRDRLTEVHLRLDFISQAAVVRVDATELELA